MKFNTRQLLYRKYRIEGFSGRASAIKAGYSPATALSGKVAKGIDLASALEIAGLTDNVIAQRIVERFTNDDGMIGHRYLETALKLKGERGYTVDKAQTTTNAVQVNITIPESGIAPRLSA